MSFSSFFCLFSSFSWCMLVLAVSQPPTVSFKRCHSGTYSSFIAWPSCQLCLPGQTSQDDAAECVDWFVCLALYVSFVFILSRFWVVKLRSLMFCFVLWIVLLEHMQRCLAVHLALHAHVCALPFCRACFAMLFFDLLNVLSNADLSSLLSILDEFEFLGVMLILSIWIIVVFSSFNSWLCRQCDSVSFLSTLCAWLLCVRRRSMQFCVIFFSISFPVRTLKLEFSKKLESELTCL